MKKRKQQSNKKRRNILGSIGIAALIFSGAFAAIPNVSAEDLPSTNYLKMVQADSAIMNTVETPFIENLDYLDELDNSLSEKIFISPGQIFNELPSMNEGALFLAIQNEDYDSWKEAVLNLEGYPKDIEPINEDEFKILIELRKNTSNEFSALEL